MAELAFGIGAYSVWDGHDDELVVLAEDLMSLVEPQAVPALVRRRASPLGQTVLRVACALPRLANARFVFASRHGEFDRTVAMLDRLATEEEPSPTDFSLGVHNALAGMLAVGTRNRRGHTAIAAGADSFGFGLLEAAACINDRPDEPVVMVYYDAPLPAEYDGLVAGFVQPPCVLALLLTPASRAARHVVMTMASVAEAAPSESAVAVFLTFLRAAAPEAHVIGERMSWTWRHV